MKKLCAVIVMAGVLVAPSVFASLDYGATGTITMLTGPASFSYGNGGEFTAITSGFLGTFQTFCIEDNEYIAAGSGSYTYRINSGAVAGGISGQDATDPFTGSRMDNISIGTAWLYSQFRKGTLAGYDYANDAGHYTSAGDLQNAIWYLEGEGGVNNNYVTLAETTLGLNGSPQFTPNSVFNDSVGAYDVVALNLFGGPYAGYNGAHAGFNQDQLAIVPEPGTVISGMLMLLPFGASTLRILRRKQSA